MWLYRLNHHLRPLLSPYWKLRLEGDPRQIPREGPLLVAPNHCSYLDPWLVGMALDTIDSRPVRYLITEDWYDWSPRWRWFFRSFGAVPTRFGVAGGTVEVVCRLLEAGQVVGLFPEGRVSTDGRIRRFRSGIARAAARTGAPVLPVGIRGSYHSLPRHRRFPRPVPVTVHLGALLRFPDAPRPEEPAPEAVRWFLGELRARVVALAGQNGAGPGAVAPDPEAPSGRAR